MSITPELRALIDERLKAEEEEAFQKTVAKVIELKEQARLDRIMADIDEAAPRLDAQDRGPTKWPNSALVKIGYCVIATSQVPNAEIRAMEFVRKSLERTKVGDERD